MKDDANDIPTHTMNEVAKFLNLGIGRNKLFKLLREKGVLDRDNYPYQSYIKQDYFRVVFKQRENHFRDDNVTLVTNKGIEFIKKIVMDASNLSSNNTENS
jgi:anti-repressor protein